MKPTDKMMPMEEIAEQKPFEPAALPKLQLKKGEWVRVTARIKYPNGLKADYFLEIENLGEA